MRRHRWMAVVPFEVTDQDALRLVGLKPMAGADLPPTQLAGDEAPRPDDERPFLGLHNARPDLVAVACWDCEIALTDARLIDTPCEGQTPGDLVYAVDGRVVSEPSGRDVGRLSPRGQLGSVGRDDPCPCGSGLKFKRCHGA